jgi:hypothetical protein
MIGLAVRGLLHITPEWAKGIIGIEGRGSWTEDEAKSHFDRLAVVVADFRVRVGPVRALVDMRAMLPQSDEVGEIVRTSTARIYRVDDRIALLVSTVVQGEQLTQLTAELNTRLFDDPFAALRWLNED